MRELYHPCPSEFHGSPPIAGFLLAFREYRVRIRPLNRRGLVLVRIHCLMAQCLSRRENGSHELPLRASWLGRDVKEPVNGLRLLDFRSWPTSMWPASAPVSRCRLITLHSGWAGFYPVFTNLSLLPRRHNIPNTRLNILKIIDKGGRRPEMVRRWRVPRDRRCRDAAKAPVKREHRRCGEGNCYCPCIPRAHNPTQHCL